MAQAVTRSILNSGGTAVIVGSRQPKLDDAVNELRNDGNVVGELANIADVEQRNVLIDRLNTNYSDVTLLVNAAGVFLPKPFIDYEESDYDLYLDMNRKSYYFGYSWYRKCRIS